MNDLTVNEFAERERVHPQTIRRWVKRGLIPVRRTVTGGIRIVSTTQAQAATPPASTASSSGAQPAGTRHAQGGTRGHRHRGG